MPGVTTNIAVVGPGEGASDRELALAREVGRLCACAGAVVLTGGLGGVMAAAAEGAVAAGGLAVGLAPGSTAVGGNGFQQVVLTTGLGEARNAVLVNSADAVVAVGGSWGTLSEIALAARTGTHVVVLEGWRVLDASGREPDGVAVATTPEDAVATALRLLRGAD